MPGHFETPEQRQECQLETCLQFERYCRRATACIFTLTTALRLLGVDWDPEASVTSMPRLHADVLQTVVDHRNNKGRDRHALARPGTKRVAPTAVFVSSIPIETIEIAEGITCTTPEFTWFMFSRFLGLKDLVILGDAMMRRNTLHEPLTLDGFADLIARVECRAHRNGIRPIRPPKGITQCRKALELMEEHTDSVMETILRLTLECYGLPRPVVNLPVRLPDGRLIFLDLAFPEAMVAVEYDGRHHSEQWAQDSLRRFAIEASGWAYVQVIGLGFITDADKRHVAELVGRLIRERTGAQDSLRRFAIEASGWAYVQVIGLGFITDADKRHVAELVGRLIRERTGKNYLLSTPLPLECVPDRRREAWKERPSGLTVAC